MECAAMAVQVPLPDEPRAPCNVVKRLAARPQIEKEQARHRREERLQQQLQRLAEHNAKVQRARLFRRRRCNAAQRCVSDKQRMAEERRQQLREAEAERLSRHHSNVVRARSRNRESECERVHSTQHKLRLAEERRQQLREAEAERLSRHHSNVDRALSRTQEQTQEDKVQSARHKQQLAEERRQQLRDAEAQRLARLHSNITRAQSRNRETVAAEREKVRKTIHGYRQRGLAEDVHFPDLQRQIMNKDTVVSTQNLLRLILNRLARVEQEEKAPVCEDTPAVASPPRFSRPPAAEHPRELAMSAREFLSAYIMAGDKEDEEELGEALKESAQTLLCGLTQLLGLLETDVKAAGRDTRRALRDFGRQWSNYKAAFAAWKRADKGNLIEHYIRVYGDVQRGRDTAVRTHSPGRREANHHLLLSAIDNELAGLRGQIAKLGGDGALAELERRLQLVGAVSPTSTPARTPPSTPEAVSLGSPAVAPTEAARAPSETSSPSRGEEEGLRAGVVVEVGGLVSQPQLNGLRGRVTGRHGERWGVRFDDPSVGLKALKANNLRVVARASDALLRAQLAHEAAVAHLTTVKKAPETSPQKQLANAVAEQMERALWDTITQELAAQPPQLGRLGVVLGMLRDELLQLAPRAHVEQLAEETREGVEGAGHTFEALAQAVGYYWAKVAHYGPPAEEDATLRHGRDALGRISAGGSPAEVVPRELKAVLAALRHLRQECTQHRMELAQPVLRREATPTIRAWLAEVESGGTPLTAAWIRATRERVVGTPGDYHMQVSREEIEGLSCAAVFESLPRAGVLDAIITPRTTEPFPEVLTLSRGSLAELASTGQRLVLSVSAAMLCATHVHISCARQGKPGAALQVRNRVATAVNEVLLKAQEGEGLCLGDVAKRAIEAADEALVMQGLPTLRDDQRKLLAGGEDGSQGAIQRMARQDEDGVMLDRATAVSLRRLRALLAERVFGDSPVEVGEGNPFAPLSNETREFCNAVQSLASLITTWVRPITDKILLAQ
eukprot:Hpha_TRINITY_DN16103_c2_g12::TRINITY_DN16103_c2_g12_i1::g.7594::m.7594